MCLGSIFRHLSTTEKNTSNKKATKHKKEANAKTCPIQVAEQPWQLFWVPEMCHHHTQYCKKTQRVQLRHILLLKGRCFRQSNLLSYEFWLLFVAKTVIFCKQLFTWPSGTFFCHRLCGWCENHIGRRFIAEVTLQIINRQFKVYQDRDAIIIVIALDKRKFM